MDWNWKLKATKNMAEGLHHLHTLKIVHGDFKSPNVMVYSESAESPVVVKISDFGLAFIDVKSVNRRNVDNPFWAAPEILSEKFHLISSKVDIYALGIIMSELSTGLHPFVDQQFSVAYQLEDKIVHEKLRPTITSCTFEDYNNLTERCWDELPDARPTAASIILELEMMSVNMSMSEF